jgi:enterochelin esterase-like enzyme
MKFRILFSLLLISTLSHSALGQKKPPATIGEGNTWAKPSGEPADLMQVIMYESEVLNGGKHLYFLHLPPSYEKEKNKRYPVIYFLHGNATRLADANALVRKLLEAYKKGTMPEVIVVAPRGRSGSGWKDNPGDMKAETVTMKSLIPHIEKTYRAIPERDARAVEGFSMGGGGALRFAFKFPEFFAAASSFGGAGGQDEDGAGGWLRKNADKIRDKVHVRVVCGANDSLLSRSETMHKVLDELKIKHTYTVIPGIGHTYTEAYAKFPSDPLDFWREVFKKYSTGTPQPQPAKKASIDLKMGWNLFSLPLQTSDMSVKTALSGINGKFSAVYSYEGNTYKSFSPEAVTNDLTTLSTGRGYWIYMDSDGKLEIEGSDAPKSVSLSEGWNLAGFSSLSSLPIATALGSASNNISAVYQYDSSTQSYKDFAPGSGGTLTSMEPGRGYWIYSNAGTTWTLP